jgi:hypothetical protein
MQQFVLDMSDYAELSRSLDVPFINLNLGDMVEEAVPEVCARQQITLHRALTEIALRSSDR